MHKSFGWSAFRLFKSIAFSALPVKLIGTYSATKYAGEVCSLQATDWTLKTSAL
jgi:hypothetical protein